MPIPPRSGARLLVASLAVAAVIGFALIATRHDAPANHLSPLPSASVPPLEPKDLYVSSSGQDGAAGSASNPLATIQAAVDRVAAGNTVWIEPGAYAGFKLSRAHATGQPITIAARTAGTVTLTAAAGRPTIDLANAAEVTLINLVIDGPEGQAGDAIHLDRSTGITVAGCVIQGSRGGFGIQVRYSDNVTIRGNEIQHNAMGIRLYGEDDPASVHDVLIEDNRIHDNDSMVVNDAAPNNDYGANGIVWHKVTGRTLARGNQVWSNRATSHDYGTDGGAFEIWASSNAEITDNVVWDNVNVMETGSDGPDCSNLSFRRNRAFVTTSGVGMILRCARDSVVANNVFDSMRSYAFELTDRSGGNSFARSIDGLRIIDNIVLGSLVYLIGIDLPPTVVLDYNLVRRGTLVARLSKGGTSRTFADFTRSTGQEQHSITGDPKFVDPGSHDYRILAVSPAIDRGTLASPGESFLGAAPDIGAYEGAAPVPSPTPLGSG